MEEAEAANQAALKDRVYEIVQELNGTTKFLSGALIDDELYDPELNAQIVEAVNEHIFECKYCGWWKDNSEKTKRSDVKDLICSDCDVG